ncbi:MAG: hypothetical protein SV775_11955, partial [Thermodesulfobacteriota bacterium]|nr:hypothetical protein [Thermodesulfobacteriota bacterium]
MKNLIKDILVIQLAKMGDILQTTPLLYRIREKYPEAGLALLVDSTFAEVSSGVQFVDEVIPFDLTSIHCVTNDSKLSLFEKYTYLVEQLAPVRERRFDIIYNINFSKMTAILSQFFRDSMIIGYRLQPKTGAILKTGWAGLIFHLMRYRKMVRFNLADLWASYENGLSKPARRLFYDGNGTGDIQVDLPVDSPGIGLQ